MPATMILSGDVTWAYHHAIAGEITRAGLAYSPPVVIARNGADQAPPLVEPRPLNRRYKAGS
jgi:hypothetical protein